MAYWARFGVLNGVLVGIIVGFRTIFALERGDITIGLLYDSLAQGFFIPILVSSIYGIIGWAVVGGVINIGRGWDKWKAKAIGGAIIGFSICVIVIFVGRSGDWWWSLTSRAPLANIYSEYLILIFLWSLVAGLIGIIEGDIDKS